MGSGGNPTIKPDLFSTAQPPLDTSAPLASEPNPPRQTNDAPSPSYALPTNLLSALNHLDDDQLDRLLSAVIVEEQRRGKKPPVSDAPSRKKRAKEVPPPLAQGKLNAVRAAFKAGVRPSRIAREFGISQSDVKKALAGDGKK